MEQKIKAYLAQSVKKALIAPSSIDAQKRAILAGIGGFLAACTAPQPPQREERELHRPVEYTRSNSDQDSIGIDQVTTDQQNTTNNQTVDCAMCAPGVDPPIGGLPGTPPGQQPPGGVGPAPAPGTGGGAGTTPAPGTGDGTGTTPAPGTGDGPGNTPAPGAGGGNTTAPLLPVQTFRSFGPGGINLQASDMMGSDTQLMSDGNRLLVWGFEGLNGTGAFNGETTRLCPGPVLELVEGRTSSIALISGHPHTLHLHGLDVDQANDGVPSTSGYVARMFPPALTPPGVNLGGIYEYQLVVPHAGTYLYHCHVDTVLHMEMGMSGTIIVRPPDGSKNVLYSGAPPFDREYIWQLHTFDSRWHQPGMSPVSGPATVRYTPDYFMINGRDGSAVAIDPTSSIEAYAGQTILVRLVNIGYIPANISLGGIPFTVLASDGRPLKQAMPSPVTEWLVAPGERYDIQFSMPQNGVTTAAVNYIDIMGTRVLGTANPTITTL